jgi:hypothetical protein
MWESSVMRGVDELCAKQLLEERAEMIICMEMLESAMNNGHDLLMGISDQCREYKERHSIAVRDKEGLEGLQFYMERSMLAGTSNSK